MNQNAIRYGGFMGLALVLVNLLFYLISVSVFFSYAGFVGFIVYVGFMVKAGLDERTELGGFMTFGEAFKTTFQVFVIGSLIYWVFYYIMFNLIDPSLADTLKQITMEGMEKVAGFLGEEIYDEMMAQIEEQDFHITIGRAFQSFITGLIVPGAIFSLIISLFIKKKNPDELPL